MKYIIMNYLDHFTAAGLSEIACEIVKRDSTARVSEPEHKSVCKPKMLPCTSPQRVQLGRGTQLTKPSTKVWI